MIREKSAIRKQISIAMDRKDYATAQYYMNTLCKSEVHPTRRKWTKDEKEFLIHHVDALGLQKACELVAKKLGRNKESVRGKYYALIRKEK